jgi:hypothetical protein
VDKNFADLNIFVHRIFIETALLQKNFNYQSWYLTPCCGLEVQKSTQELQSVKGPANTFHWNPKWATALPSLIYFSWDINRDSFHKKKFKYQVDIWHPAVGLTCRNPPRHFSQLKARTIPFTLTPSGQELCRPWYIFHGILIEIPSTKCFQISSSYFTPCCGLEVQKLTQALQSIKGAGNTFDWDSKWTRTLPFLIYCSWDIYRDPSAQKKN